MAACRICRGTGEESKNRYTGGGCQPAVISKECSGNLVVFCVCIFCSWFCWVLQSIKLSFGSGRYLWLFERARLLKNIAVNCILESNEGSVRKLQCSDLASLRGRLLSWVSKQAGGLPQSVPELWPVPPSLPHLGIESGCRRLGRGQLVINLKPGCVTSLIAGSLSFSNFTSSGYFSSLAHTLLCLKL